MASAQPDRLHLLGIRHHGPGSARAVLTALDAADPAVVLIEGPPDADELISFAASPAMVPPIALLVHAQDDAANASFFPFAMFSPEWQAIRWALEKGRPVRFIDLPASHRLAERAKAAKQEDDAGEASPEDAGAAAPDQPETIDPQLAQIRRDPLAYLSTLAGYDDSETWWNALVEQGTHGPEIFAALEAAIGALREKIDPLPYQPADEAERELRREAHMRLEIAAALGAQDGPVAVVCGAWHVPALRKKVALKDDRALLKGLTKVTATWVPWTETRLAASSGYGAGVISPGWYAHLWQGLQHDQATALDATGFTTRWQARVAELLRRNGRPASTASVIEASRLAITLAALRDVALPGLAEMREASLATLCEGETALFRLIEQQLIIGQRVGEIDDSVPQMPLAADLARWQRKLKLKPEALDSDVALDLRSEAGLAKSQLLHRLALIQVPWGRLQGSGQSRGTFRENWRLRWEPEFSVRLVEALVHGTTVAQAAGNAAVSNAQTATSLNMVAAIVRGCLEAGLSEAAETTIALLQQRSAATSDVTNLTEAVPPLAEILRYGTARELPTEALRLLVISLVEAICAGLVYACRNLQADVAADLRGRLARLDAAIGLIEDAGLREGWRRALASVANDAAAHPLLKGLASRALYDHGVVSPEQTALALSRALSHSVPTLQAGDWLDGFLGQSGQVLLHDHALRRIIDGWLAAIDDEAFNNLLPVMRRAFSSFDRNERRRLLDELAKQRPLAVATTTEVAPLQPLTPLPAGTADFEAALPLLLTILGADRPMKDAKR
ncbi:conserved protein of unknown function [Bradyrhizobium sp. ORS 285]|uniref:DUF5682 family protein n=1 Tax=Bradyrhizobium sp. ORS 285 TaxID=115808 RepID=UPI000240616C|nr:DUF5682 family protein [Bradyrhizobium sp. ORS 285]CCD84840.1 conserved hypothetical protein [Bradyrhizobium sp. ORS 285]SMX55644.1 conserved protein of unknown function [Bradyrhizobium sp. ORS 285]